MQYVKHLVHAYGVILSLQCSETAVPIEIAFSAT